MRRWLGAVALLALLLSPGATAWAQETPTTDVNGNAEVVKRDREFHETIFINGEDEFNLRVVREGGCPGCRWQFVPTCISNGPSPAGQPVDDDMCGGATVGCPPLHIRVRIYLTRPPEPIRQLEPTRCIGPGDVVQGQDAAAAADDVFKKMTPKPGVPRLQQASAPLVNLAAYFTVDGPLTLVDHVTLQFMRLDVTATPEYTWVFGDGQTLTTEQQGRPYRQGDDPRHEPSAPDAIMHWYETPGAKAASVTTTWTATYTITFGNNPPSAPFPVAGAITPPAQELPIDVHEGRAVLYS